MSPYEWMHGWGGTVSGWTGGREGGNAHGIVEHFKTLFTFLSEINA